MRALITGAGGLLGHALARHLAERGDRVYGTFRHPPDHWPFGQVVPLELGAAPGLQGMADQALAVAEPDIVFHLAALTNVAECEAEPHAAWSTNVGGTAHMASATRCAGSRFVYMSTDSVFDGRSGNYGEEHSPSPINWYGCTKVRAEEIAQAADPGAVIVRGTFYGLHPDGHGTLAGMLNALRAGRRLRLSPDAYFSPLPAPVLAQRLVHLGQSGLSGIRHLPGPHCSRWAFGMAVAQHFGLDPALVQQGSPVAVATAAVRPVDTSLITHHPGPWPVGELPDHLATLTAAGPPPGEAPAPGTE
ncbi:MAG: dTDP-4-dehydrorhamnose reductase [Firmicutes bacterium]|nr:dTDP-4-dehydrorhamnose reductase [Bacillota bacterium]